MAKREWSDTSGLKSIKNPSRGAYEIKIKSPEITFLGAYGQPDCASAYITFYPAEKVIELKSLKEYFFQFRNYLFYSVITNLLDLVN